MDVTAARNRLIGELSKEIGDPRVLEAMSRVPRERFVLPRYSYAAYQDKPLPIGYGQTISQPLIVAMMTQALDLKGNETVLEVGTGSGYQAAVLAELAETVISVERIPELAEQAARTLNELGYTRVQVHLAGDDLGWKENAPYRAIIVTAGAPSVPARLVDQLETDGILVIPVGTRDIQELCKVTRHQTGTRIEKLGGCRFVSLVGKGAWESEYYPSRR